MKIKATKWTGKTYTRSCKSVQANEQACSIQSQWLEKCTGHWIWEAMAAGGI